MCGFVLSCVSHIPHVSQDCLSFMKNLVWFSAFCSNSAQTLEGINGSLIHTPLPWVMQLKKTAEIRAVRKLNDYDLRDCIVPLLSLNSLIKIDKLLCFYSSPKFFYYLRQWMQVMDKMTFFLGAGTE